MFKLRAVASAYVITHAGSSRKNFCLCGCSTKRQCHVYCCIPCFRTFVCMRAHTCYFTQSCRLDGGQSHSKFVQVLLAARSLHRIYAVSTQTYKLAMATVNEHCLIIREYRATKASVTRRSRAVRYVRSAACQAGVSFETSLMRYETHYNHVVRTHGATIIVIDSFLLGVLQSNYGRCHCRQVFAS